MVASFDACYLSASLASLKTLCGSNWPGLTATVRRIAPLIASVSPVGFHLNVSVPWLVPIKRADAAEFVFERDVDVAWHNKC